MKKRGFWQKIDGEWIGFFGNTIAKIRPDGSWFYEVERPRVVRYEGKGVKNLVQALSYDWRVISTPGPLEKDLEGNPLGPHK